jgi:hypothetical protein
MPTGDYGADQVTGFEQRCIDAADPKVSFVTRSSMQSS